MKPPATPSRLTDADLDEMTESEAIRIGLRTAFYWRLRRDARVKEALEALEDQRLAEWKEKRKK